MKIVSQLSALTILAVFLFFISGCNDKTTINKESIEYKTWHLPETVVLLKNLPIRYSTTGTVISDNRIEITSRVSGFIQKINAKEGERVTKGKLLVLLDGADVKGAINQAKAAKNKATSSLRDTEIDRLRLESLYKRGAISENEMRKVRLQQKIAKDSLQQALAALKTAQAQQQYIRITSPITGVIVARQKREGDLAVPGAPILTVESGSALLFETYVAESWLGSIKSGDSVHITIDAIDKPLTGTISRIVPSGDPLTRKSQVKITLPIHKGLLPGMFGRASVQIDTITSPVIPVDALVERGGLKGVFVLDNENRTHFRWLQTGKVVGKQLEVRAGLKGGERIVAVSDTRLHEGDFIKAEDATSE